MSRVLVTGGTGFLGGRLVSRLLDDGVAVRVLARRPERAGALRARGVEVVAGDIERPDGLREAMLGCDVVFHLAAWYALGVTDLAKMERANDLGVGHVLDAAREAGVPRVVVCSSVGVYGDTAGGTASEGHCDERSVSSLPYTKTKRKGHERALAAAASGQDIVIVVPGSVFGPGDPSIIGRLLSFVLRGWMKVCFYRSTEMPFVHVDDVADGFIRAWRQGTAGREYILVERCMTLGEVFTAAAKAAGRSPPWYWLPNVVIRWSRPFSPLIAPIFGQGPWILRDAVAMMDGTSLKFSSERARTELGWAPRPFEERLAQTVAPSGR